jgi:hypothetical protein
MFKQSWLYTGYQSKAENLAALRGEWSNFDNMVHSVPDMGKDELRAFVDDLRKEAEPEYLFVTSNNVGVGHWPCPPGSRPGCRPRD